jgi:HEAT repeat protein
VGASCSQQFFFIDKALSSCGRAFRSTPDYNWLLAYLSPPQLFATEGNYIEERHWELYPSRHGSPEEVALMVADEVDSLLDEEELTRLEKAATNSSQALMLTEKNPKASDLLAQLQSRDEQIRLKAIQKIEINSNTFSVIMKSLDDEKAAIRRWAAALLGASANPQAVEPLSRVLLNDSSAIVRRTAGDALSDLGDEKALPTMCQALEDSSKLVRWRAARFLNEAGEPTALLALRRAKEREKEFDVRLEMSAAEERIEGGGERQLPMWMRLSQSEN